LTSLQAVILGAVQGLTEFLPVSSSGHLALFRRFLGAPPEHALALDVAMHGGTLGAMAWFFRKDLLAFLAALKPSPSPSVEVVEDRRRMYFILLASVVTCVVGLGLKGVVEKYEAFLPAVGVGFLATTAFLLAGILGGNSRVVYSLKEVPI
jgi:undecaprenyl-diphosphatase